MQVPARDNVVQLRKHIDPTNLANAEQAIEIAKQIRIDLSDDLTQIMLEQIMGMLTGYGIFVDDSKINTLDIIMLENALEALMYRYYGLEHALHEITDNTFEIEKE